MSLTFGQYTAGTAGTVATQGVLTVPPGPCSVTITATSGTAYISSGAKGSANASSTNGYTLASGGSGAAVTFTTYPGSTSAPLWITGAGTGTTLQWIISTPQ